MKLVQYLRTIPVIFLLVFAPLSMAGSDHGPVATMAGVIIGLNHYPSAEEKTKLKAIADNPDYSDHVKTIAMALHDMQHSVSAADKEKLQAIAASEDADEDVKTLAEVLMNVNHKASDDAVAKLKALKS